MSGNMIDELPDWALTASERLEKAQRNKLPKPQTCPCCGGELVHTTRIIETIGRGGFRGRGPVRTLRMEPSEGSKPPAMRAREQSPRALDAKITKVPRSVHICPACQISVVLHRLPRTVSP